VLSGRPSPGYPEWLEAMLADPVSGGQLQLSREGAWAGDRLVAPLKDGVLRFASHESYADSFGREWNWFSTTQLDVLSEGLIASRATFSQKTGWAEHDLQGKVVLDAGCGMGRFAEVANSWGARVVAVDLSSAVDAARANLADRMDAAFVQADLFELPFRPATFDLVYAIGVLHHTPDAREAFRRLVQLVRPGGSLAVWLYSKEPRDRPYSLLSDVYRVGTSRLRHERLLQLCRAVAPLGRLYGTRLGRFLSPLLPVSTHRNREWRVLDTFDWYAPKYQSKHRWMEVEGWFHEAGFVNVRRNSPSVAVAGDRPQS
jgi:SAM-dependent methyltransferase